MNIKKKKWMENPQLNFQKKGQGTKSKVTKSKLRENKIIKIKCLT